MRTFRPIATVSDALPDLDRFIASVAARLESGGWRQAARGEGAIYVARAPGRLDVMGGIADYSGSLVLQWPLREATRVALRRCTEPVISIVSTAVGRDERVCEVPL